jgi:hypothetical protein
MALAMITPVAPTPLLGWRLSLLLLLLTAKTAKTAWPFGIPLLKLRLLLPLFNLPAIILHLIPLTLHLILLLPLLELAAIILHLVPLTLHLILLLALFELAAIIFHLISLTLHLVLLLALFKLAAIILHLISLPLHLLLLLALFKLAAIIVVITTHDPFLLLASFFKPTHVVSLAVPAAPAIGYIVPLIAAAKPLHPARRKMIVIAVHTRTVNSYFVITEHRSSWSCCFSYCHRMDWLAAIPFCLPQTRAGYKHIPLPVIVINDGSIVDENSITLHAIAIIIHSW